MWATRQVAGAGAVREAASIATERDIENTKAGYAAIGEAYRKGDLGVFRAHLARWCEPGVEFSPAGVLPESTGIRHGVDGIIDFMAESTFSRSATA